MIHRIHLLLFSLLILFSASGCEVIGGIFKVGFWAGVIVVVLVVFLLIWLIRKFF